MSGRDVEGSPDSGIRLWLGIRALLRNFSKFFFRKPNQRRAIQHRMSVTLLDVVRPQNYAKILMNVQPTTQLAHQRVDVVDLVTNARFFRQPFGLAIDLSYRCLISPLRSGEKQTNKPPVPALPRTRKLFPQESRLALSLLSGSSRAAALYAICVARVGKDLPAGATMCG